MVSALAVQRRGEVGKEDQVETSEAHKAVGARLPGHAVVLSHEITSGRLRGCVIEIKLNVRPAPGSSEPPGSKVLETDPDRKVQIESEVDKPLRGKEGAKFQAAIGAGVLLSLLRFQPYVGQRLWLNAGFDVEGPEFQQAVKASTTVSDPNKWEVFSLKGSVVGQGQPQATSPMTVDFGGSFAVVVPPAQAIRIARWLARAAQPMIVASKHFAGRALQQVVAAHYERLDRHYRSLGRKYRTLAKEARRAAKQWRTKSAIRAINEVLAKANKATTTGLRVLESAAAKLGLKAAGRFALRFVPFVNLAMLVWDVAEIGSAILRGDFGGRGGGGGAEGKTESGGDQRSGTGEADGRTGQSSGTGARGTPGSDARTGSSGEAGQTATGQQPARPGPTAKDDRPGLPLGMVAMGELPRDWSTDLVAAAIDGASISEDRSRLSLRLRADATEALDQLTHPGVVLSIGAGADRLSFTFEKAFGGSLIFVSTIARGARAETRKLSGDVLAGLAVPGEGGDRFLTDVDPDVYLRWSRGRMVWKQGAQRKLAGQILTRGDGVVGRITGTRLQGNRVPGGGGQVYRFWLSFDVVVDSVPAEAKTNLKQGQARNEYFAFLHDRASRTSTHVGSLEGFRQGISAALHRSGDGFVLVDPGGVRDLQVVRASVDKLTRMTRSGNRLKATVQITPVEFVGQTNRIIDDGGTLRQFVIGRPVEVTVRVSPPTP